MIALDGKIMGQRPRGRPRKRWADRINGDLNKCAQGVTLTGRLDRDRWRNVGIVGTADVLQNRKSSRKGQEHQIIYF